MFLRILDLARAKHQIIGTTTFLDIPRTTFLDIPRFAELQLCRFLEIHCREAMGFRTCILLCVLL